MQKRIGTTATGLGNTAVLQMARAGNQAAWDEIIHRYERVVRAAVVSYRPTSADAADAIQNTWLRLFEHAASIRDPEKLGGWLRTTARREYLALVRRQRAEQPFATIDTDHPCLEPTPEAVAITTETRRQVRLATDALPNRPRALIDALYYHPCGSYADVARHTGIPIGSIGPTRLRTLRRLRRHITTESQPLQGPLGTCGGQLAYTRPNRDDPVGTTRKAAPHDRRDSARGKPGSAPRPR